ncbi:microtubule-associated protein RP/EB family member 1-like [Salvia splendens]|uniref:microtubule-associated protein RP/EB family member 1-like n=1 Tax=Salvia splendens TaxID=180675 RepID=UPI001C26DADB|nr:microtubule-associated protein RP/EB family member 1-like [Salvia splendens]
MENQPPKNTSRRKNPQLNKARTGKSLSRPSTNPPAKKPPFVPQLDAVATPSSQTVIPNPVAVRPEPAPVATTTSVVPPVISVALPTTTAVATTESIDEPDAEQIMMEFLQKYGQGPKASEFYARLAARKRDEVDEEDVAGNEAGNVESGQGHEEDVDGEILAIVEGEILVVVEGVIPTDVDGEIPEDTRTVENEEEIVGEDDGENVENEELVDESVETEEDIPEAKETLEKEEEVSAEAVERRFDAERKRKGKQEAKPLTKKHRQASSTMVIKEPILEPIRVPFAKPLEVPKEDSEEE